MTSKPPNPEPSAAVHKRPSYARHVLGILGAFGLLCCSWVYVQTVGSLLADFAFFLIPAGIIALIVIAAVIGWVSGLLKRWSITRVALVTVVAVLATPVVLYAGWVVKGTVDASRGAECPGCAVSEYLWNVMDDPAKLHNYLCGSRRNKLAAEAKQWADTYQDALDRWGQTVKLSHGASEYLIEGNRATVTTPVSHVNWWQWNKGRGIVGSAEIVWRFEVVNENGWRVCAVELPDVCTQLIKCEGPAPTPTATAPTPSFRPWSDWDTRVRWECFPDAGQFARPGCPTPPADWTQPGPAYCAPTYPSLSRSEAKRRHCHELGWQVE